MNQHPFLQVDYRLLALNEIEHNGEKHKLTLQSKLVYSYLLSLSKSFDTVRPSLQGIADQLGLGSEQVARREIKTLAKAGLVSVIERPGTSNAFVVNPLLDETESVETSENDDNEISRPEMSLEALTLLIVKKKASIEEDETLIDFINRFLSEMGIDDYELAKQIKQRISERFQGVYRELDATPF